MAARLGVGAPTLSRWLETERASSKRLALILIPGGRYAPEFAVEVATCKYLDHLPLERQVRIMEREGLSVDSHTLWDQIEALARHLEPSYAALAQKVLGSELIHTDETYWRLMEGGNSVSPRRTRNGVRRGLTVRP